MTQEAASTLCNGHLREYMSGSGPEPTSLATSAVATPIFNPGAHLLLHLQAATVAAISILLLPITILFLIPLFAEAGRAAFGVAVLARRWRDLVRRLWQITRRRSRMLTG